MKPTLTKTQEQKRLLTVAAIVLALGSGVVAGANDLADVPLANSTTLAVPPNIAMVIDDSMSMNDENMPDDGTSNTSKYCYRWYGYNTLAYKPATIYKAPIKADGTRFPDASFSAAPKDGYFAVNGSTKMYDGSTTNSNTDLNSFVTVTAIVRFPDFGTSQHRATSVLVTKLDGTTIQLLATIPAPASGNANEDTVGAAVATSINSNTPTTGFSASYNASDSGGFFGTLTITGPSSQGGLTTTPSITLEKVTGTQKNVTASAFTTAGLYYATDKDTLNSSDCESDGSYNIVTNSASIVAPSGINALTNFANWYSYYRKRAFLMKAGTGEAFGKLAEDKFRIGYFTIASVESGASTPGVTKTNNDLKIDLFSGTTTGTQRALWFARLYGTHQAYATPLRGALSRMGRMYAGKVSVGATSWDPVQYSCQRNYTILSTDGYWNDKGTVSLPLSETDTYTALKVDNLTFVGDQDGAATRPEYGAYHVSNSLADVAYYYYHTDLRTSDLGNCTGASRADASTGDVCTNDVPGSDTPSTEDDYVKFQHMTTYTIGLGVADTLTYDPDYKTETATSTHHDYYDIKHGTKDWPNPDTSNHGPTVAGRVDDLWHAAVNGRGLYLSAKDATSLASGLNTVLNSIAAVPGAGGGAAAADLAPVTGGTEIYIAKYQTDDWYGDVSAYAFDADHGTVGALNWTAGALLDARVAASSDTRTIYVNVGGVRKLFTWGNLDSSQRAYFDNSKLSQYAEWSSSDISAASGEALVNYLRGQYLNEDQRGQAVPLYRYRKNVLGDIVHSAPMYVKESSNTFVTDRTYGGRMGMLYVAANDGMLHAFCTEDPVAGSCTKGKELWAYVIPPAMKEMWYLADKLQRGYHHYFVDGPMAVTDVYMNGGWKTILVGGLGKGGRGYYAMDITDPTDPKLLWTFTADDNAKVGYSYGLPLLTKVDLNSDGKGDNTEWRVLLTSGYNNIPNLPKTGNYPSSDGGGYLFLLDPADGTLKATIPTGQGSAAAPSGLAQVQTHAPNFATDNSSNTAYGGDLLGNMWRFDLVANTATKVIGVGRPISTGTEIGTVEGYPVLFFGTGRYLGQTDLTDTAKQYIVAVKANQSGLSLGDLVDQTGQTADISWTTDKGWYRELAGTKERVAIDPQLYQGRLIVATILPEGSECTPGGTGRLYKIDYSTGIGAATDFTKPIVGFTIFDSPLHGTPATDPAATILVIDAGGDTGGGGTITPPPPPGGAKGTRIMWRELID